MSKTAIVGFGGAGYHAALALREADPAAVIDVYTETPEAPYNPMLTTYYVAGKIDRETLMPYGSAADIAKELHLNLYTERVQKLYGKRRALLLKNGEERVYDDIVLATGSHPLIPPIPGLPKENIYVMRTVSDADRLLMRLRDGISSAVVIGASWVGIKVVEALFAHGIPTVMADMSPRIFPTATLPEVAEIIHNRLQAKGIGLKFGSGTASIRSDGDAVVSTFADETELRSDIVVLCLGLRPTVDIVDPAEFKMGRGLYVDRCMRTSVEHVYAIGDCCEALELISGQPAVVNLWANAFSQGQTAGRNIAGIYTEFQGNFIHNITHFLDIDFIGLGDNRSVGEKIVFRSPSENWEFHAIMDKNRPRCINILDNRRLSGPAKAALMKRITAPDEELGAAARLALRQSGLPGWIIARIGGHENDGT